MPGDRLPRLVLLHGPGVGGEAFRFQRSIRAHIETPPWIRHFLDESLAHYAARMAETIEPSADLHLGGVSFGGMVSLEMARRLRPRSVILIGSGRSGRQGNPILRGPQRMLKYLPSFVYESGRRLLPPFMRLGFLEHPRAARDLIVEVMKHDVNLENWSRGMYSVADWTFQGPVDAPVYHIHGDRDWLIPIRLVKPDRVVHGGPHLMNITHPREVNAFIEACLQQSGG